MDAVSSPQTTSLAAGEQLCLSVRAGTTLVAVRGMLRVQEPPRWLAESMVYGSRCVAEGQAYEIEQTGWHCVTAEGAAQLVCVPSPGRIARLAAWLRGWRSRPRPAAC